MSAVPPAGAGEPLPTPAEIENWPTSHLADAAAVWRTAAGKSTDAFEQHRQNITGAGWEGLAQDAALGRVDGDLRVAGYHGEVLTEAASAAEDGLTSVKAAKREAAAALKEARDDGFAVADDLSVTDARTYDINTIVERNRAAKEHAENIRWTAERLVQADAFVGKRLTAKATELHGLRFEGEGDGHGGNHVQLVDNKTTAAGDGKGKPDEKSSGASDPNGGLAGLLGVDDPATKKPGEQSPWTAQRPPGQPDRPPTNPLDLLAGKDGKGDGSVEHPKTLQEMMLPGGPPAPARTQAPAVKIDPNSPEGKAAIANMRQILTADGKLSPAEIDQRINTALANMDKPLPVAAGPEQPGPKPPLPGLGERMGDMFNNFVNDAHNQFYNRLDSTVNTAENLTGTGGPGHPGVAESWEQLGKAHLSQLAQDPLHLRDPMGPLGPLGAVNGAVHDIPEAIEHPGKYAGDKLYDASAMAAGTVLGEAGAPLSRLLPGMERAVGPEVGAIERGVVPGTGHTLEHAPVVPRGVEPPVAPHVPVDGPPPGNHPLIGHSGDATPAAGADHSAASHTGKLPEHGEPGSFGYDDDGNRLKYANDRPGYGPTQVPDVWNQSRDAQVGQINDGLLDLPMPGPDEQWVRLHPDGPIGDDWTVANGHRLIEWAPGDLRNGLWDMGHVEGREYAPLRERYLNGDITFEEFMKQYRNPENYQVQDPYRNRSHIDEGP